MRLFIGIPVDTAAQRTVQASCAHLILAAHARLVPPSRYHITLAYLGERDASVLPCLAAMLDGCAADIAAFDLTVRGIRYFGKPAKAIVYAAFQPSETLERLNCKLHDALRTAAEPFDDKPLVPHITLAREAALSSASMDVVDFSSSAQEQPSCFPTFTAQSLALFHSTRIDGTLAYLPLHHAPFHHDGG